MPGGQPTIHTEELANEILTQLSRGEPLSRICDRDDMPCISTIMNWVQWGEKRKGQKGNEIYERFLADYIVAREKQTDVWVDQCVKIADDDSGDIGFKEVETKDGITSVPFFDRENVMRSKLRAETRLKVAAMQNAKKYGTQRIEQRQVDKDGNDVAVNINIIAPKG